MRTTEIAIAPTLRFLTDENKKKIHAAVLAIMEETGMRVHHEAAVDLLKKAGCAVDGENVKIPAKLVENAL